MPIIGVIDSQKSGHLAPPTGFYSISSATVDSGGASTITFSSIPSSYKHLQIRAIVKTGRTIATYDGMNINFNSDTGTNYTYHYLYADHRPSFQAGGATSQTAIGLTAIQGNVSISTNIFGVVIIDILDYTNSNKYKTVKTLTGYDNNTTNYLIESALTIQSGLWMSTSGINSISFSGTTNGFIQNTQFALYGVI